MAVKMNLDFYAAKYCQFAGIFRNYVGNVFYRYNNN